MVAVRSERSAPFFLPNREIVPAGDPKVGGVLRSLGPPVLVVPFTAK